MSPFDYFAGLGQIGSTLMSFFILVSLCSVRILLVMIVFPPTADNVLQGVVRTAWASLLSAASVPSDALPATVYKALVEGAATGGWPDGSVPGTEDMVTFMEKNGPKWQVAQGAKLDVPVLFGQGTTDSLFPLEQALQNFRTALTKRARKQSIFTAYNGGHVLPAVLPSGVDIDSDPCAEELAGGDFTDLTLRLLDPVLKGTKRTLTGYGRYHLATPTDTCVTTRSVLPRREVPIGTVATSAAAGAPVGTEIAAGPLTVAGGSYLTALATTHNDPSTTCSPTPATLTSCTKAMPRPR